MCGCNSGDKDGRDWGWLTSHLCLSVLSTEMNHALMSLEDHLSDIDMSRDFHSLGGWPHLVALLDSQYPMYAYPPRGLVPPLGISASLLT